MAETLTTEATNWVVAACRVLHDKQLLPTLRKVEALAYLSAISGRWPLPIPEMFPGYQIKWGLDSGLELEADIKHIASIKDICVKLQYLEQDSLYEGYRIDVKYTWFTPNMNYVDFQKHLAGLVGYAALETPVKAALTAHTLKLIAYGLPPDFIATELKRCIGNLEAADRKEANSCSADILHASVAATIELAQHDHNGYVSLLRAWLDQTETPHDNRLPLPVFGLEAG